MHFEPNPTLSCNNYKINCFLLLTAVTLFLDLHLTIINISFTFLSLGHLRQVKKIILIHFRPVADSGYLGGRQENKKGT